MKPRKKQPSDLFWSRYLAGEVTRLERWRFERALRRSAELRRTLETMEKQKDQFDSAPERLDQMERLRRLQTSAARDSVSPRSPWRFAPLAMASATGLVVAISLLGEPDFRAKGDLAVLEVFVTEGEASRPLGASCRAGDRLQGRIVTTRPHVLLLEQDGRGIIRILEAIDGVDSNPKVPADRPTRRAWMLDDTPGVERFVALFSEAPISEAKAENLLRGLEELPADRSIVMREVRCRKIAP
ncbi:MAG: hypothetical protein H6729_09825 [Deltaproteobacteria bacterium]|nr:hypothetical protein [Deltaproteobacteria bacterium]